MQIYADTQPEPTIIELPLSTLEVLTATVRTPADPSGAGLPSWLFTQAHASPDDAAVGWSSGLWSGSYTNGRIVAVSPSLADEDAVIDTLTVGWWNVWIKFPAPTGEIPIRQTHRMRLY